MGDSIHEPVQPASTSSCPPAEHPRPEERLIQKGLAGVIGSLAARIPALTRRLGGPGLAAQFVRGAFWTTAGALASRFLSLLAALILARLLGAASYGEYGVVLGAVGMFNTVAGAGMGLTATRYIAHIGHLDPERAGRILGLSNVVAWIGGLIMAIVLYTLAPWLATTVLTAPDLVPGLRISALLLVFSAWNGAQIGALNGLEAFRDVAVASILSSLLLLIGVVIGAKAGGVIGALWGCTIATFGACLIHRWMLLLVGKRRGIYAVPKGALKEWRILIQFSIPSVLATLFVTPVNWAAIAIIARGKAGFIEAGIFTAANQWRVLILFLPTTLAGAALPLLTRASTGDPKDRSRLHRLNLILTSASSLMTSLAIIIAAPWLMRAYGSGFSQGTQVLQLLAIGGILAAILNVIVQLLIADGRMWSGFALNAVWGISLLCCAWAFRHRGALGLALANLVAYSIYLVVIIAFMAVLHRTSTDSTTVQVSNSMP